MKSSSFPGDNAIKEKDRRYILVRSKRGRYDVKCVDKNSWEYWEYHCSDGHPGRPSVPDDIKELISSIRNEALDNFFCLIKNRY